MAGLGRIKRDQNGGEATAEPTTFSEAAYQRLRADIVAGVLEAGKPLRLEALRQRYGLSFSPLREALMRLQSERLVRRRRYVVFPSRRCRVRRFAMRPKPAS